MQTPDYRFRHAILVASGTVLACVLFFWVVIEPTLAPKRFHVVEAGTLYRSGSLSPTDIHWVFRRHHIRTIVDLGAYSPDSVEERRERAAAQALGIRRYRFALEGDSTGNPNAYVEVLRIMNDPASQPVLVHCGAGTERTGYAVYMYRTLAQGWSPEDALAETRRIGQNPLRNPWFMVMLVDWGEPIRQAWVGGGLIPGLPPLQPLENAAAPPR